MFKTLLMMVVVMFSSQLAAEKIYKWVDEDGQIHYGSQKPVDKEAQTIKLKKNYRQSPKSSTEDKTSNQEDEKSGDAEAPDKTAAELKAEAEAEAAAKAQLAAADKVNKKQQCDVAKSNLASLNASTRVTRLNEQGDPVRMTDDERVKAMQTAQQGIKEFCK